MCGTYIFVCFRGSYKAPVQTDSYVCEHLKSSICQVEIASLLVYFLYTQSPNKLCNREEIYISISKLSLNGGKFYGIKSIITV